MTKKYDLYNRYPIKMAGKLHFFFKIILKYTATIQNI